MACRSHLGDNEIEICTSCRHHIPVTNFHFNNDDTVKKILFGRVRLVEATALLHFSKQSLVQELMHNLKYRGHESIGKILGKWLGSELAQLDSYRTIDLVTIVPLHNSKLRKRGYNQVTKFGEEIAKALKIEFKPNVLKKESATKTQVFKSRLKRWSDSNSKFKLDKISGLTNKHILLVDDIITTGATMEACANELIKIPDIKLSIATMAITD